MIVGHGLPYDNPYKQVYKRGDALKKSRFVRVVKGDTTVEVTNYNIEDAERIIDKHINMAKSKKHKLGFGAEDEKDDK